MKKLYKFAFFFAFIIIVLSIILSLNFNKYDFNLKSEFSENTSLKDFVGKKLIVYFGYTFCPDVCPVTLSFLSNELNSLQNDKAMLLFVTLDLERDKDINKTNEYLRYFYKNSHALLAKNEKDLEKIAKNYGVIFQKIKLEDSAMKYSIAHSNMLYLLDEKGEFKGEINDLNPSELKIKLQNFLEK